MTAAVSGVPAEAIARAMYDSMRDRMHFPTDWDGAPEPLRQSYRDMASAALPALREQIAAEVLGPVRDAVAAHEMALPTRRTDAAHAVSDVLLDLRRVLALSAPVQAAEPTCTTCGGALDSPPCSRSTNGASGHTSGGGSRAAEGVDGE